MTTESQSFDFIGDEALRSSLQQDLVPYRLKQMDGVLRDDALSIANFNKLGKVIGEGLATSAVFMVRRDKMIEQERFDDASS